ncbi:TPA: DUF1642 domain-containing protein [Enterococcus faecium]|uniref:DUF1642 domain-containing protein n=1 Tax=Enterococcus faecium TaxID=1352 RepID=UPI000252F1C6|nr:DUF1642 domain-containing protein [Enterococcus faecium]AFC64477.1 hypothetical protein EFAU004_02394 [Enterococcus faecium Aus0004]HAQ1361856.1 DUF1642 domain-containing protein [Enterococcus faecium Ef_aus0098]MDT9536400.1 DUF1642 domain-containing protein [Enterococcus faecium]MDT9552211.1 DUF1642 domain-containing protein [Enterococcus faecium]HAP9433444.1 DUF1642 domain-containing protein [Enterococcus faecium]
MNKQELINELKKISLEKQHKALTHPESKNYYEGMVMAYSQVVHMVNTVLKLDEPQKPVVPKFVAEWFEENKDDLEFEIWSLCVNSYCSTTGQEMMNWIQQSENKPIETLIRMKEGYEVEKEPLYEVIIGDLYLIKKFNNRNDFCFDTSCSLCAWEKSAYQLTEAEIKAIAERYWPFAVPVEEVAEG